ncbi:MAG: type IV toxin-antitoxin system AbiEi family antitoxin domain-containing protein [Phycisphaerae bacterium]
MANETLHDWIDVLQSHGKYTFSRTQAETDSGLTKESVKKALQQLRRKKRVAKVKNYFYVIVPAEYRIPGAPPPPWYIHDLMRVMERPYYVGLLTAAGLHGVSHQQPQEFQVMTDRPTRSLIVGRSRIRFVVNKFTKAARTRAVKTPTGSMHVSTPETTAFDLVRYARTAGGINHVANLLAELTSTVQGKRLVDVVRQCDDIPNTQRLGYLLEQVEGGRQHAKKLLAWLDQQATTPSLLVPSASRAEAQEDRRWRLVINSPVELEA